MRLVDIRIVALAFFLFFVAPLNAQEKTDVLVRLESSRLFIVITENALV